MKYVAAECNLQLKKYAEAEKLYRELVAAARRPCRGRRLARAAGAGRLLAEEVRRRRSPPCRRSSATLKSPDATAEAQFLIGASQFYTDKFAEAAKALAASLAANPKWRQADEALLLLGRAQAKLGKPAEAKASLRSC